MYCRPPALRKSRLSSETIPRSNAQIALRLAVAGFHRLDDFLQSGRVVPISGEHFVAQRQAAARHHQADADLFAVGAMIARVTAFGQGIRVGLALEVRAGHVVQQQVVLDGEQLAEPLLEKRFQRRLVRQQLVQPAVQAIVVHLVRRHAQQIGQRALAVKVFGDMQLARRLAEPRDDQDQRRQRPGNMFLSRRHRAPQELVQSESLDEFQGQPRTAELPAVLDPHSRAVDLDEPRRGVGLREQFSLR